MTPQSDAQRLMDLFRGFETAHGTYDQPTKENRPTGIKWGIGSSARTRKEPPTLELFQKHLQGEYPLGIIPITQAGTCWWGSIDVDDYSINPLDVIARIESRKLPLVPATSKSGGLHLFLFLTIEQPAATVQTVLTQLAAQLGLANSEIFPKQTQVLAERGDVGNWLCLPYLGTTYGGKLQEQTGLKKTGARETLREFLNHADNAKITAEQLSLYEVEEQKPHNSTKQPKSDIPFSDGPPCLQHLADQKIFDGQGRNNTLFMMALYYIRKDISSWKQELEEANRKFFTPPLDSGEVQNVIHSVEKKGARDPEEGYKYTCKKIPMCNHCNSKLCRGRQYGIGSAEEFPRITGISKLNTEPPIWFINIGEIRLEATTEQLQQYTKLHQLVMEKGDVCFRAMKQADWLVLLGDAMKQEVTLIEVPEEVSITGQFKELLYEFLTDRQTADDKEELIRGLPWSDPDTNRVYFKLRALQEFLDKSGFKNFSRGKIVNRIKEAGGDRMGMNLKGGYINVWFLPLNKLPNAPLPPLPTLPERPV